MRPLVEKLIQSRSKTNFLEQEIPLSISHREPSEDHSQGKLYLSFDMDVVDSAFAPGVSTPVPGGLSSSEALYLVREVSKLGLVGFDLMEVSPPYDVQEMTSHLGGRIILEAATGVKPKTKPAIKAA